MIHGSKIPATGSQPAVVRQDDDKSTQPTAGTTTLEQPDGQHPILPTAMLRTGAELRAQGLIPVRLDLVEGHPDLQGVFVAHARVWIGPLDPTGPCLAGTYCGKTLGGPDSGLMDNEPLYCFDIGASPELPPGVVPLAHMTASMDVQTAVIGVRRGQASHCMLHLAQAHESEVDLSNDYVAQRFDGLAPGMRIAAHHRCPGGYFYSLPAVVVQCDTDRHDGDDILTLRAPWKPLPDGKVQVPEHGFRHDNGEWSRIPARRCVDLPPTERPATQWFEFDLSRLELETDDDRVELTPDARFTLPPACSPGFKNSPNRRAGLGSGIWPWASC